MRGGRGAANVFGMTARTCLAVLCLAFVGCDKPKSSSPGQPSGVTAAKQELSESNMRGLLVGIETYALEHGGKFPDTLEDLRAGFKESDRQGKDDDFERMLTNPLTGEKPGYVYKKPAEREADLKRPPFKTPILWELKNGKPDDAGAIGYADYKVERKRPSAG